MRKRTIRFFLKVSLPVTLALFGLVVADFWLWNSTSMTVLLSLMTLTLVAVLVLLVMEDRPRFLRIDLDDNTEPSTTVIYPRDPHG